MEKGMHNKNSKNNRIIKIKTDFFNNYMIKLLKVHPTKKKCFKKLQGSFTHNLKKSINLKMQKL